MCHYSHCRRLGQTGKEKRGGGEKEKDKQKGGGKMEINDGINGLMQQRLKTSYGGLAQAVWTYTKGLKMSQTCDFRLLNFMEYRLCLLPLLAFAKCGWSSQWFSVHNSYSRTSCCGPFLSVYNAAPHVAAASFRKQPHPHIINQFKTLLSQVCYSIKSWVRNPLIFWKTKS